MGLPARKIEWWEFDLVEVETDADREWTEHCIRNHLCEGCGAAREKDCVCNGEQYDPILDVPPRR